VDIHNALSVVFDPLENHNVAGNNTRASRWLNCKNDFATELADAMRDINQDDAIEIFRDSILVDSLINPDKIEDAAIILRHIIKHDEHIKPTTEVDLVNKTTKHELLNSEISTSAEFFAGVFLYAIKRVDNRAGQPLIAILKNNKNYFTDVIGKYNESPPQTLAHSDHDNNEPAISSEALLRPLNIFSGLFYSPLNNINIAVLIAALPCIVYFAVYFYVFRTIGDRPYLWFSYIILALLIGSINMYIRNLVLDRQLNSNNKLLTKTGYVYSMSVVILVLSGLASFAINQNAYIRPLRVAIDTFYLAAIFILVILLVVVVLQCLHEVKQEGREIEFKRLLPWLPFTFSGAYVINSTFVRTVMFGHFLSYYIIIMCLFYIIIAGFISNKVRIATSVKLSSIGMGPVVFIISMTIAIGHFVYTLYYQDSMRTILTFLAAILLCVLFYALYKQAIAHD